MYKEARNKKILYFFGFRVTFYQRNGLYIVKGGPAMLIKKILTYIDIRCIIKIDISNGNIYLNKIYIAK